MEDKYKVTGNFYSVNTRNSKEKSRKGYGTFEIM